MAGVLSASLTAPQFFHCEARAIRTPKQDSRPASPGLRKAGLYAKNPERITVSFFTAAAAEPVKGDRQVCLLEIVDVLKGALDLLEEAALTLVHFSTGFADDEVMDRPLEYELIAPAFADNTQLLDNAEGL